MTYKEKTEIYINNMQLFSKLEQYVQMIEEKNKIMNLTGFKKDTLWKEGIYESIVSLENVFNNFKNKKMLDIGAGAGFPSIPFKIIHPEIQLFIYEPIQKRVDFLQNVSNALDLNIKIKKIRAEESKEKNVFDFITARAVTALKALIEISFHLGKVGCYFAFIKGPNIGKEMTSSLKIIHKLQLLINIEKINIDNKKINIVKYIKKHSINYEYPRLWSKIVKEL